VSVWSVACLGDGLKVIDFFAVLASMAGVFLVSLKDWGTGSDTGYGDLLGLVSACVYGLYTTFLKRVIGDDSRVDMLLFFGFLGLFNTLIMWIFIPVPRLFNFARRVRYRPHLFCFFITQILNITHIEPFHWPSWHVLAFLSLNGVLSVLSDYCWARSILLTSPLMANIGLSLAVPLSMVPLFRSVLHFSLFQMFHLIFLVGQLYDFIFNGLDFTFSYLFGSLLVLVGFALINASFVGEDNDLREVAPQSSPIAHANATDFNFVDSAAAPNIDQSLARMAQAGAATASYEISSAAKSEYEVRAEIGEEFRLEPVV
jgi:solute carrier family 35 protein F5